MKILKKLSIGFLVVFTAGFLVVFTTLGLMDCTQTKENRFIEICKYSDADLLIDKETKIIYVKYHLSGIGITPLLDSEGNVQYYEGNLE